jgi:hypothetical protein
VTSTVVRPPRPGDHVICFECAAVLIYNNHCVPRELTDLERIALPSSPAWPEIEILVEQACENIRKKRAQSGRAN